MIEKYNFTVDLIRSHEYPQLEEQIYLDHAGTTPYPRSLVESHYKNLVGNLFGNPHSSGSPSSLATLERVDQIRSKILRHFNTQSQDYTAVFTSNATAALNLIGSSLDWNNEVKKFWYLEGSHTSVVGLRGLAHESQGNIIGAPASDDHKTSCVTIQHVESYLKEKLLAWPSASKNDIFHSFDDNHLSSSLPFNLFAYPGQCNFSGTRYPLEYINALHARKPSSIQNGDLNNQEEWRIILDAASLAMSSPIDLKQYPADFVVLSFYKLFGFPTGVGAVLIRKGAEKLMHKRFFGGGTVSAVAVDRNYHRFRNDISAKWEDGTVPFLEIIALEQGFDFIENTFGGWKVLRDHTLSLTEYVYNEMKKLKYDSGVNCIKFYSKSSSSKSSNFPDLIYEQGPIVNFNIMKPDGIIISPSEIQRLAGINNIHLRAGCFCNPGACQKALKLSAQDIIKNLEVSKKILKK